MFCLFLVSSKSSIEIQRDSKVILLSKKGQTCPVVSIHHHRHPPPFLADVSVAECNHVPIIRYLTRRPILNLPSVFSPYRFCCPSVITTAKKKATPSHSNTVQGSCSNPLGRVSLKARFLWLKSDFGTCFFSILLSPSQQFCSERHISLCIPKETITYN